MQFNDPLAALRALTREKRDLEARLKEITSMLGSLEPTLRDFLMAISPQPVHIAGFVVYIREQLWVRAKSSSSGAEICQVLKACGMGQFVREQYEVQSLSAHVRGLKKVYEEELSSGLIKDISDILPPRLAAVLSVQPTFSVVAQTQE